MTECLLDHEGVVHVRARSPLGITDDDSWTVCETSGRSLYDTVALFAASQLQLDAGPATCLACLALRRR